MTAPSSQTPRDDLLDLLIYLSGHFQTASAKDERAVNNLQRQLARALGHDDISDLRSHFLSIDASDLFFASAIAPQQRDRLSQLLQRNRKVGAQEPELRVFVRNVALRSTQIPGSVPAWAVGAPVAQTLGPFTGVDGRQYWFDFFRITRLVALYVQGNSEPAVLFNTQLLTAADPRTTYHLTPDTVWIDARLLASNATAGLFSGLKIRGGTLTLSAPPQLIAGKWTVAATTRVSLTLDLDPTSSPDTDDESPYGIDARHATLQLPKRFALHFTGGVGAIDGIDGDINRRVYGQTASFRWSSHRAPEYDSLLNRILIPLDCNERRVEEWQFRPCGPIRPPHQP